MKGPNGEDVEGPMELTITGSKVTGEFRSGADRVLKIEKGLIEGNELKFTVPRDRPQGGTMVYEMTGKVTGGTIQGNAEAEFNGQKRKVPWSARRPEPAK
jgi:hypothetical protein